MGSRADLGRGRGFACIQKPGKIRLFILHQADAFGKGGSFVPAFEKIQKIFR